MSDELREALWAYFKSIQSGKCAPSDWSFNEQETVTEVIRLLENEPEEKVQDE